MHLPCCNTVNIQKKWNGNIARNAKAALHKFPGKSNLNVRSVCPVSHLWLVCPVYPVSWLSCLSCLSRVSVLMTMMTMTTTMMMTIFGAPKYVKYGQICIFGRTKVCLVLIFLNTIVEKHTLNPEITLLYHFHAQKAHIETTHFKGDFPYPSLLWPAEWK